jgi:hypothetical protein
MRIKLLCYKFSLRNLFGASMGRRLGLGEDGNSVDSV